MIKLLSVSKPPCAKKVFEISVGGFIGRWFARRNWRAFTFPLPLCFVILYWGDSWRDPLIRLHESIHLHQFDHNVFFLAWIRYLRAGAYDANTYEIEAYEVEADAKRDPRLLPEWTKV